MYMTSANEPPGDRVYQAVKARVIAYDFSQGQRIYLAPIAKQLGVSTTPVAQALNRLAAEGLILKCPRKGFIALTLSEDNLKGHYELTRRVLLKELGNLEPTIRGRLSEFEPIAAVLSKLKRRRPANGKALATYTGQIFAHIAALTGDPLAVRSIKRANDHLYYIRTIECQILENDQSELRCFCELLLTSQSEQLISAINAYHDKRVSLLQTLLDFLRQ